MPVHNLKMLFQPESVAVIGATNRENMPGSLVMHNLLRGGFEGPVMPVSPEDKAIAGVLAYPDISSLPVTPDLAVVCTPSHTLPDVFRDLGERGTRAVVLMTAGNVAERELREIPSHDAALATARAFGLRIVGPNGLGLMVPGIGLNASIAHASATPGGLAFVSQSSGISAALLDWAQHHGIGFSHFISLGDTADIDFGDVIDYLGSDPKARAILLYIETVRDGRTFMSAGRGASRNKPILVIKAGRAEQGQNLATLRSGIATGNDDVYDAAIRRAGMLRVYSFGELFAAVETLARAKPLKGEKLAIVTNSCGVAVMAVDALTLKDGHLATLSEETVKTIDALVPDDWPGTNPITLRDSAPPDHYAAAVKTMLNAGEVDAVMVLHAPTAMASSAAAAAAVIDAALEGPGNVLTSWMGGEQVVTARRSFADAGIPTYDTPTQAVDAFMHMVRFRRNQKMLMQTPPSKPAEFRPATDAARLIVEDALAAGRSTINGREAMAVLAAYTIATTQARVADTPHAAADIAQELGFPVALKILSSNILHKAEVGGVDLFLDTPDAVKIAAENMLVAVKLKKPDAILEGFTVETMVLRPGAQEIRITVAQDPVFGPVVTFGQGGPAAEIIGDRAVALPPLNMSLAHELITQTRISRLLEGYGDRPPANIGALCLSLIQVSQMIVDLPELVELDINPLFVDEKGVLAVDARMRLAPSVEAPQRLLAIRPYPKDLEEEFVLTSGTKVLLRPIRPEDEPAHYEFLSKVTAEDIRFRFFGTVSSLPHSEMARLTQIDYDREMAFVATAPTADGNGVETLGVVRTITDLNNDKAEYAILVRSDLKGQRLGWKLLDKMVHYCRSRGTKRIVGQVLRQNRRMLDLVHGIGFTSHLIQEEDVVEVTLEL
jgi:acetyltransferase